MTADELLRLADDSEGSPLLRELLQSAEYDSPKDEELAHLSLALSSVLLPAAPSAAGLGAAKPLLALGKVKAILGVVAIGAVVGTGYVAVRTSQRDPSPVAALPVADHASNSGAEVALPDPVVAPVPSATSNEPPPAAPARPSAIVSAPPAPKETETALLGRALAALRAHDGPAALTVVAEERRQYPVGAFTEEFRRVEIEALVLTGRTDRAQARAARFFSDYPKSAHRARIQALLGQASGK